MAYKILIIDDHPETRSIIGHVLKQQGYVVVNAENGKMGVDTAERERPHIILCDYMMPVMDGVQAVRHLRANTAFDKVPIIMFTAVDDPQQKLTAFDAGADDYLNKPTEPSELIERVRILLETSYGSGPPPPTSGATLLNPSMSSFPADDAPDAGQEAREIVAVMGVRGGVGTTTTAINLASTLAKAGRSTALVDFDMSHGHIGLYLNQKTAGGANTLATMTDTEVAEQLTDHLVTYNPKLRLMLAHPNVDGRYPILAGPQAGSLLIALSRLVQTVVVDLGSNFNEITRSTLELADHVYICLRPERIALVAARQLLDHLRKTLFPQTTLNLILLDFSSSGVQLPQTAVEGFLGYPVTATIHISPKEIAHSVNKASPLVFLSEQTPAIDAFKRLAQQLQKTG